MDLYQFEDIYNELGRQEKKQFADYINSDVLNLEDTVFVVVLLSLGAHQSSAESDDGDIPIIHHLHRIGYY